MKTDRDPPSQTKLIKAYKKGWQRYPIQKLIHYKVRSSFHSCLAQGLENVQKAYDATNNHGILALANHSNWWDFMFGLWLNDYLKVDGYGMTTYSNMEKYGFFRRVGIFSMEKSHPASMKASLDYTTELLDKPRSFVWMMPQGQIMCNDIRPLQFQEGLRLLLRRARRITILPVALRYEFWQDEKPEACVRFGTHEVISWSKDSALNLVNVWEDRVTSELELLKKDCLTQSVNNFQILLHGPRSINERMESISKYAK